MRRSTTCSSCITSSMATGCSRSLRTTVVKLGLLVPLRTIEAKGKPTDFWGLKLPKETQGYVPRLLAMRRLVADPEAHGLGFSRIQNQPYFARVETNGQIDLKIAADIVVLTHEQLSELNPRSIVGGRSEQPALPTAAERRCGPLQAERGSALCRATPECDDLHGEQRRHGLRDRRKFNTKPEVIREIKDLPSGTLAVGMDLRVPTAAAALPPEGDARCCLHRWTSRCWRRRSSARARRASWRHAVGRCPPYWHGRQHTRNDERHAAWRHAACWPKAQAHCSRAEWFARETRLFYRLPAATVP